MAINRAAYTYRALVTDIYDADTIICDIDIFDNTWKKNERIRLYGINANEIKRSKSKGRGDAHVEIGFKHRDVLITALGLDPRDFPQKVTYHELAESGELGTDEDGDGKIDSYRVASFARPVEIVIQTVLDKSGKFGRLLGIIHKNGVNINELLRDEIGGVEFYDGKEYPADYPIRPPS